MTGSVQALDQPRHQHWQLKEARRLGIAECRQLGSLRLMISAAKTANASTPAPSRNQPALASPLIV